MKGDRLCSLEQGKSYSNGRSFEIKIYSKTRITKICPMCKRIFYVSKCRDREIILCSKNCYAKYLSKNQKGKGNNNWKGGKRVDSQGYIFIYKPDHPLSGTKGYVYEHRLVVEKHINRFLKKTEQVHHINGDKKDNRIKNLMVFKNGGLHTTFHISGKVDKKYIVFDGGIL